jgi:hypothetical protein
VCYLKFRLRSARQDVKHKRQHQLLQARQIVAHDKYIVATKRRLAQLGVHD